LDACHETAFSRWFTLSGSSLKTAPRGYAKNTPMLNDIKRKYFIAIANIAPALVEQGDFSQIACDYFTTGTPLIRFLCSALRLPC